MCAYKRILIKRTEKFNFTSFFFYECKQILNLNFNFTRFFFFSGNCHSVVLIHLNLNESQADSFCPRCNCKYQTRSLTVIKVVVILVIWVILISRVVFTNVNQFWIMERKLYFHEIFFLGNIPTFILYGIFVNFGTNVKQETGAWTSSVDPWWSRCGL